MPQPVLRSAEMRRVERIVQTVAPKDVTVTFIGESGTGKEVFARRTHDLSNRRRGPFVPINCAAIPETLFESELFGHERGAFTGANERMRGKIEAAQGGTLFLDEIGEMPIEMQAKLLRFLEGRRFSRIGSTVKIDADVRLIVATLRPLEQDVHAGRFRPDLYYRIQGITLTLPPLRERRRDIPALITRFVEQLSARHGTAVPRLSRTVKRAMLEYDWPGNVRELHNTIEAMCLLRAGKQVRLSDLPGALQRGASRTAAPDAPVLTVTLDRSLEAITEEIIEAALRFENGNRTRAAERLDISVRTVQRYISAGRARAG